MGADQPSVIGPEIKEITQDVEIVSAAFRKPVQKGAEQTGPISVPLFEMNIGNEERFFHIAIIRNFVGNCQTGVSSQRSPEASNPSATLWISA